MGGAFKFLMLEINGHTTRGIQAVYDASWIMQCGHLDRHWRGYSKDVEVGYVNSIVSREDVSALVVFGPLPGEPLWPPRL